MIPKVINYCWFGGKKLPESAIKCINSWKKYFPDYQIKQWNEKNIDFSTCKYALEAYQEKKWAFVSDYARFYILYNYGGLYFDTDVEIIRDMSDIIAKGSFIGCESRDSNGFNSETGDNIGVNPGLGLGAEPFLPLVKEILDLYNGLSFKKEDGTYNEKTVVYYMTNVLLRHGFNGKNEIQKVSDFWIYPSDFFCPLNYFTGQFDITSNSRSIHWYSGTWVDIEDKQINSIQKRMQGKGVLGNIFVYFSIRVLTWKKRVRVNGLKNTISYGIYKIKRKNI